MGGRYFIKSIFQVKKIDFIEIDVNYDLRHNIMRLRVIIILYWPHYTDLYS